MILPPGSHDAAGAPRARSTASVVRRYAAIPGLAAPLSLIWGLADHPAEALALLKGPDPRFSRGRFGFLGLYLLAELGLHASFVAAAQDRQLPESLSAALGRACLEAGDPARAMPALLQAVNRKSGWGAWLNAATGLAMIDPGGVSHLLRDREREPVAALLLAHLAERSGDLARARRFAAAIGDGGGRPVEADLFRATLAASEGDAPVAKRLLGQALAWTGLLHFDAPPMIDAEPRDDGPLVTIVVAAFNAEATIASSLASLLAQSWQAIEIILVDDASQDATAARAEETAGQDKRVRIIRRPVNGGAYVARNDGIMAARGQFIAFHDADDLAHPLRIARQIRPLLDNPDLAATICNWIRVDPLGRTRDRRILPAIRLQTGSAVIRGDFARAAIGGFDPVRFGADGDLLLRLRLAAGAGGMRRLTAPLTLSMVSPDSAVHSPMSGYGDRGYSTERLAYREASIWRGIGGLLG